MFIFISSSFSLSLSLYLSIYLFCLYCIWLYVCIWVCHCVSICVSVCLCICVCVCVLSFYPSLYFDRVLFLLPLQTCPRHYLVFFFITLESSKTTLFSLSLNILLLFYLSKTEWTVVTLTFRACLTSFKWLLSHTYQSHCYDPSLFFLRFFFLTSF